MTAYRLTAVVLSAASLLISTSFTLARAATSPVGATPGQFRVSESGAATYNIPIGLPPGTAGMQPALSLDYNSQGGNGLLGVGWSLNGLSAISRCSQTQAQDGVRGSVNYDANDRFCLDGQRLIVVSGAYGADGAEYRTEIESYSRIISYGAAGNGPAYFKVWSKSGQVMEYGVTNDSRIEAQGKSTVAMWALNKVQDTVGNYLTVTYLEDNANGQYYPTRIDYTGNVGKGLTPYNSVQFVYEARPDVTPLYHAGSLMKSTVRMSKMQSYSGNTLVKEYRLKFDNNGTPAGNTGRSRMTSIQECAGDGVCLSTTTLSWQINDTSSPVVKQSGQFLLGHPYGVPEWVIPFDYDGDGYQDLAIFNSSSDRWYTIAHNNRDGTFTKVAQGQNFLGFPYGSPQATATITVIDYDGDGKQDLLFVNSSSDAWYMVVRSNGDGTFQNVSQGQNFLGHPYGVPGWVIPGDFNGDGIQDIAIFNSSSDRWYTIALGNGDGTFTKTAQGQNFLGFPYGSPQATATITAFDYDGDGKQDLLFVNSSSDAWYMVARSNGNGTFQNVSQGQNFLGHPYGVLGWVIPGDFNGDGIQDIAIFNSSSDRWYTIALGNGNGTFAKAAQGQNFLGFPYGSPQITYPIIASDFNRDGRTDLAFFNVSSDRTYMIALSNADGAFRNLVSGQNFLGFPYGDPQSTAAIVPLDVNGDGRPELLFINDSGDAYYQVAQINKGAPPDILVSVTNGLNATTSITYKPLTDNTVYSKDTTSTYPTVDIQAPMYVVANSSASDGIGGNYQMNYHYTGLKATQDGRGSLGFRTMDITDPQTGIVTHNEYRQDYPYIGAASLSTKKLNGTLLNQAQNTYTAVPLGGTRYAVMLSQTVESSYELNGAPVTTMTTSTQYDAYGNPTQIVTSTNDGYTKTSNNTYTNDTGNWLLGRLTLASVASATPNAGTLTRTSSFAYNPANGLLTQEVVEPNNSALRLQTDYGYDGYGNKITVTVSGAGITSRTTSTAYDSRGQFPVTTTNALNQSDNGTYDARFGKPATLTGPNALTTTWSYDGFGRKVNEARADGTQTTVAYYSCDGTCPSFAKYYVSSATAGAPTSYAYFDTLSREVRMAVQGFDGRLIIKDTYYDSLGRVDRVTKPYYSGDSPLFYRNQYDVLGRVLVETSADNSTKQMSYNGLVSSMTNSLSQTETKTKNSQGQLVAVTDNLGNTVSYLYDPFGNLLKTTDAKGNVTTLSYDLRGRKIAMADPDMGNWSYQYNVLGELIAQTDAKNQVVSMSYDILGRILGRNEPDLNSTWVYDTAVKGVGKLTQSMADNGSKRVYTYDSFGRVATETSTIDTTYTISKSYDAYGRVSVLTYPTGVAFKNIYNAYGYLAEVRNNATNALFWKGNARDADGHTINETLGNGLTTTRTYTNSTGRVANIAVGPNGTPSIQNQTVAFDSLGNLIYRYDPAQGQSEAFAYDGLNRLTTATQGAVTTTVAYDSIGNIVSKSDVGSYTYGAKPHAVTQVTGTLNTAYSYDANGNMTSGAGRTLTLTSYNLPSRIVQGGNTVDFLYDADHMRIRQVSATETSIYLNPRIDQGMHFEKEVKGSVTEYKHYIYGAAGVVGVYTTSSAASPKTSYFHQDHLGSIVAVTDDSANVVARYKFDPWGKRIPTAGDPDATHHGFTGHEHLDEVGLIHMNGRIYDPVLGRFMSADPYIQSPDNLQSYNRYSYVWNNPLSATDPSGYFSLKKIFKALVNPNQTILKNVSYSVGQTLVSIGSIFCGPAYALCSAAGNYDNAKAHGLSTGQALRAGAIAGITASLSGVGSSDFVTNVALHGLTGCVGSAIQGGSCGAGALSGAFSAAASSLIPGDFGRVGNTIRSAVIGGTASVLGGGKFANGAVTGAFRYLVADTTQPKPRLSVVFGSTDNEFFNSPEEAFRYHGGDPELVRAEIDRYANTPRGREVFSQAGVLTINPAFGDGPNAAFGGTSINYDGGRPNGFAHEIGHTIFGGSYCDYAGQAVGCGSIFPIGNVQANENPFRAATGQQPRRVYIETDRANPNFGKVFNVGP